MSKYILERDVVFSPGQGYLFMKTKHHKSEAFQVVIQLVVVTTKEIYIRTQAVYGKRPYVERLQIKCF